MSAKKKPPERPPPTAKDRQIYVTAETHRRVRLLAAAFDTTMSAVVAKLAFEYPLPKA